MSIIGYVTERDGQQRLVLAKFMDDTEAQCGSNGWKARPLYTFDVDELAQIIRRVDGGNTLGAGELAERIVAALTR